jgi:two-component system phosphate regulon sensor histidine kinase PhoR
VNLAGSWRAELRKLLLVLAASAVLGWATAATLEMLCLGLAGVAGSWLWQLWRMRRWLETRTGAAGGLGHLGAHLRHDLWLQRENREARGRLQSTVDYLRSSFASMRDGVVILTQSGAIEWCNAAAGTPPGSAVSARSRPARTQPAALARLSRVLSQPVSFRQPAAACPGPADPRRFLQVEITTFAGGDFLIFVRDVTRVVQMEQMRRDFVGNVSHELRTPLTVFKGYLDTIRSAASRIPRPRLQQPLAADGIAGAAHGEPAQRPALAEPHRERARGAQERGSRHGALLEELREELRSSFPERLVVLDLPTPRGTSPVTTWSCAAPCRTW